MRSDRPGGSKQIEPCVRASLNLHASCDLPFESQRVRLHLSTFKRKLFMFEIDQKKLSAIFGPPVQGLSGQFTNAPRAIFGSRARD